MTRRATLFLPRTGIPVGDRVARAAAAAEVAAERSGLLRRTRAWRVAWPDLALRVVLLDEADRQACVREACRRIEEDGGDGRLQRRLVDAPVALAVEVPGHTADRRVAEFVRSLRVALDACALDGGRLEEPGAGGPAGGGAKPRAPTLRRVLRRLLVTQALVARGHLEREAFEGRDDEPGRILAWLQRQDAGDELAPGEREAILRGAGLMDDAQVRELSWKAEALAVLAWSLGATRLPPHDRLANPYDLLGGLGFLDEVLHPRLLVPEPKGARECDGLHAELAGHAERLRAGDPALALRGVPLGRADPAVVDLARHIAAQRLAAIAWVCGT